MDSTTTNQTALHLAQGPRAEGHSTTAPSIAQCGHTHDDREAIQQIYEGVNGDDGQEASYTSYPHQPQH